MLEKKNNIVFSYKGENIIVPIQEPWNMHSGNVLEQKLDMENVDKTKSDPHFILHLTEDCNLACKYCFEGMKGKTMMPLTVAEKLCDRIKKEGMDCCHNINN